MKHDLGLYGIQAARYYLDVYPKASVVLLEADDCIGGVWSSSMHTLCQFPFRGPRRLLLL